MSVTWQDKLAPVQLREILFYCSHIQYIATNSSTHSCHLPGTEREALALSRSLLMVWSCLDKWHEFLWQWNRNRLCSTCTHCLCAHKNLGLPKLSHKNSLTPLFTSGISCFNVTEESPAPKLQWKHFEKWVLNYSSKITFTNGCKTLENSLILIGNFHILLLLWRRQLIFLLFPEYFLKKLLKWWLRTGLQLDQGIH